MAGYLSLFAPDYKNRRQMNGGLRQSQKNNNCNDRSDVEARNSRRDDIISSSFQLDGDCGVGCFSDAESEERNDATTCGMPGCTDPSARSSRQSSDSSVTPPMTSPVLASSGRSTRNVVDSTDGLLNSNAECCDDQRFRPHKSNCSTPQGCYYNQDSEYEERCRSQKHNPEQRTCAENNSRFQSPDFQDFRSQNTRSQDAELANDEHSRSSYFLNLGAMDRKLGQQNETRRLTSTPTSRSSAHNTSSSSSNDHGSRSGGVSGQHHQLTNRSSSNSIHRKNLAPPHPPLNDQSLHRCSPTVVDPAFVRGGVRRSLQLPRDTTRSTAASGRVLAGTKPGPSSSVPLVPERNRSFRVKNLSNVGGPSHNGSSSVIVRSVIAREKADDKRIAADVIGRSLNGTSATKTPWPHLRKTIDEEDTVQDEDDDGDDDGGGGTENKMKVRFQAIYGTIRRKCKPNQRNMDSSGSASSSSSAIRNGLGSLTQSTSLAHLPGRKSPMQHVLLLQRGPSSSASPKYQRSGGGGGPDGAAEWSDPVYDARNNLNCRVYGSMSPMFSPTDGKSKTGIPMLVGQQAAGGMTQSTISLSTRNNESTNALHRKTTNKISPGGQNSPLHGTLNGDECDSDSELSDALSVFSMNGSMLMVDVFNNLTNSTASIRKDGLNDLQYLLRSGVMLSKKDVKRLTEIFTRMFHDPQAKVFSLFLEVLVDFINFHAEDLEEWIAICVNRLLTKVGADLLGSVQIKVQRALKTIRDTFPCDMQMYALARFAAEPLQISNTKVKEAVLSHLHELFLSMSPSDLSSDSDHQLLWTLLINWSMDSKPSEARKSAQRLIIAMFNLNPPVFSLVLAKQTKASQDFVRKILHSHLRMASNSIEEDDETESDAQAAEESRVKFERRNVAFQRDSVGRLSQRHQRKPTQQSANRPAITEKGRVQASDHTRSQKSRKTTDASHEHTCNRDIVVARREPKTSRLEQQQRQINRMSEDSGIYFGSDETRDEFSPDFKNEPVFSPEDKELGYYDVNQNTIIHEAGNGQEHLDENKWWIEKPGKLRVSGNINPWILDVVATFSDTSASEEKRKQAMKQLIQTLPDNYEEIAESNLKTTLGVLLLTSGGTDEVSELADECISLLLKTRTSMKRIEILTDVVDKSDFPINLAALKLQYSELQCLDSNEVSQILTKVVPSLIKAYENNESRVRKASLLSLVHLHKVSGEDIWQYISNINENKQNLLMMYFRRASPEKFTSTHL